MFCSTVVKRPETTFGQEQLHWKLDTDAPLCMYFPRHSEGASASQYTVENTIQV